MSYKSKLLTYFAILFAIFALSIVGFQWQRDRKMRREMLENRLESYSDIVAKVYASDSTEAIATAMELIERTFAEELRITVIDLDGTVRYEHWKNINRNKENHSDRPEVIMANHESSHKGSDIRVSHTTGEEFFYFSKRYDRHVVRVAVPFNATTQSMLETDNMLLWFVFGIFPFVLVALVYTADRFGESVEALRQFVDSAERGLVDYEHLYFPRSELGETAKKVVDAYRRAEEGRIGIQQEKEKKRLFKRQVSNNISHELRTPVAAIQGYLETMVNNPQLSEQQRQHFVSRAYVQSQRLSALIRDVALITKMDEAPEKIPREPLNLYDVVEEVKADLQSMVEEKGVGIDNRITDEAEVMGNYSLLYSVFRNLIENSMKYAAPCQCTLEIVEDADDVIALRFYDNGHGVPEEHLSHLFERFYRADEGRTRSTSSRMESGTGLGLSIVRNAIIFHGGSIRASNRLEGGLQFDFSLKKE